MRRIKGLMEQVAGHPVFNELSSIKRVRRFMEYQVWCVWDFMVLLRAIQNDVMTPGIGWLPPSSGGAAKATYELLLSEETDVNERGDGYSSHFEVFIRGMEQAGANVGAINTAMSLLRSGRVPREMLAAVRDMPDAARVFVSSTLDFVESPTHMKVAAFAYGREKLLPGPFKKLLNRLPSDPTLQTFRWYLSRHVMVDSEDHGPICDLLIESCIGRNALKLEEAERAAVQALRARLKLFDGILTDISNIKTP